MRTWIAAGLLAALVVTVPSQKAQAQGRSVQRPSTPQRYSPRKPVLTPYLNLTLPENGGLPNYQAFVLPLQNQRKEFEHLEIEASQAQKDLKGLDQRLFQIQASKVRATGNQATFGNMSHYYPTPNRR